MSDIPKPIEEQPAPVDATTAEKPVAEAKVVEPTAETTDVVEPATDGEETPAAPAAKEFTGEGVLGYKAPGGFMK
jgi:hypothetical protein